MCPGQVHRPLSEWSCLGLGAVVAASGTEWGWGGSQKLGAKVGAAVEDGASGEDNGQRKLLSGPSHLETVSSDGGEGECSSKQPRKGRIAKGQRAWSLAGSLNMNIWGGNTFPGENRPFICKSPKTPGTMMSEPACWSRGTQGCVSREGATHAGPFLGSEGGVGNDRVFPPGAEAAATGAEVGRCCL